MMRKRQLSFLTGLFVMMLIHSAVGYDGKFEHLELFGNRFNICRNLPGIQPLYLQGDPATLKNPMFVADLPEGFILRGICSRFPNVDGQYQWEKQEEKPVVRDGKKYTRYTVRLVEHYRQIDRHNPRNTLNRYTYAIAVFENDRDLEAGTARPCYWHLETDGKAGKEKKFDLVAMPSVALNPTGLKKFGVFVRLTSMVLPGDTGENHFRFWQSLSENRIADIVNPAWTPYTPAMRKKLLESFNACVEIGTMNCGGMHYDPNGPKRDNVKVKPVIMTDGQICASHWRGPGYIPCPQFLIDNPDFLHKYAIPEVQNQAKGLKIKQVMYDYEPSLIYEACWCPDCVKAFRKFAKISDSVPVDELKRMKMPWFNFRTAQNTEIVRITCAALRKAFPGVNIFYYGAHPDSIGGDFLYAAVDQRKTSKYWDQLWLPGYTSRRNFFNIIKENRQIVPEKTIFAGDIPYYYSSNYTDRYQPLERLKQNIIAAAALGCGGWAIWPNNFVDGLQLHGIREAYEIIAAGQKYYFDGKRADKDVNFQILDSFQLPFKEADKSSVVSYPDFTDLLKCLVHKHANSYLLTFLNYDEEHDATLRIAIPGLSGKTFFVRDLATQKICAEGQRPLQAIDIRRGFPVKVPKGGVVVIEAAEGAVPAQDFYDVSNLSTVALQKKTAMVKEFADIYGKLADKVSGKNGFAGWGLPSGTTRNLKDDIGWHIVKPFTGNLPAPMLSCGKDKIFVNLSGHGGSVNAWRNADGKDILRPDGLGGEAETFRGFLDESALFVASRYCPLLFQVIKQGHGNKNPSVLLACKELADGALEVQKELTLSENGNQLTIKYMVKNTSRETKSFSMHINAAFFLGTRFSTYPSLDNTTKINFGTDAGPQYFDDSYEAYKIMLTRESDPQPPKGFRNMQLFPGRWDRKPIVVRAEKNGCWEELTFLPESRKTELLFFRWFRMKGHEIIIRPMSETLSPGETWTYTYSIVKNTRNQ